MPRVEDNFLEEAKILNSKQDISNKNDLAYIKDIYITYIF